MKQADAPVRIANAASNLLSQLFQHMEVSNRSSPETLTASFGVLTVFSVMLEGFVAHETGIETRGEVYKAWVVKRELIVGAEMRDGHHRICDEADAFCEGLYRMSTRSPNAERLYADLKAICITLTCLYRRSGQQSGDFASTIRALGNIVSELRQ